MKHILLFKAFSIKLLFSIKTDFVFRRAYSNPYILEPAEIEPWFFWNSLMIEQILWMFNDNKFVDDIETITRTSS